ncbi:MAG: phage tail sheath subtilisin-like domain-containing protein [Scytonematopsis contorta HA4267-MV1]|jgi:hypothetical protein|nr:phage tail sheath subtilisin-like domain-containing protein [Scytonematopsis contorta HA4267-MV1]
MPTYLSPGVYVEEILSGNAPIAGVGTSTAGFIGVIPFTDKVTEVVKPLDDAVKAAEKKVKEAEKTAVKDADDAAKAADDAKVTANAKAKTSANELEAAKQELEKAKENANTEADKKRYNIYGGTSVLSGEVKLCTNFSEFKKHFGDFSAVAGQNTLAHAVYGFFTNGGTRCYVVWVPEIAEIDTALSQFEAIDEIAIVAAPGITDKAALLKIDVHCGQTTQDSFAIFDTTEEVSDTSKLEPGTASMPGKSGYAALYYPWIQVFDPVKKGAIYVPPSGHIAGVYARVDTQRGVHKAPANETVLGAMGLKTNVTKALQDGLNPHGINCIRSLNGSIKVWGARTFGGDKNGEFMYINIRRLFSYLRESIDEGTQWAVFEPNSPELWAKIRRNINAFLLNVWRSGALFGSTPEQAFFVKCDEETNPPETRDVGQVVTIIGVAVVKPAEFVIFKISQRSEQSNK